MGRRDTRETTDCALTLPSSHRRLSVVPDLPPLMGIDPADAYSDERNTIGLEEIRMMGWADEEPSADLRKMIATIDAKFAGLTKAQRQSLLRKARFGIDGTIYWGPEPI